MNENTTPAPKGAVIDVSEMSLTLKRAPGRTYDISIKDSVAGTPIVTIQCNVQLRASNGDGVVDLLSLPHKWVYRPGGYDLLIWTKENGEESGPIAIPFAMTEIQARFANDVLLLKECGRVRELLKKLDGLIHLSAETKAILANHDMEIDDRKKALEKLELRLAVQISALEDNNGSYGNLLWSMRKDEEKLLRETGKSMEESLALIGGQKESLFAEFKLQFEALAKSLAEKPPVIPPQFTAAVRDMENLRVEFKKYAEGISCRLGQRAEDRFAEIGAIEALTKEVALLREALKSGTDVSKLDERIVVVLGGKLLEANKRIEEMFDAMLSKEQMCSELILIQNAAALDGLKKELLGTIQGFRDQLAQETGKGRDYRELLWQMNETLIRSNELIAATQTALEKQTASPLRVSQRKSEWVRLARLCVLKLIKRRSNRVMEATAKTEMQPSQLTVDRGKNETDWILSQLSFSSWVAVAACIILAVFLSAHWFNRVSQPSSDSQTEVAVKASQWPTPTKIINLTQ